MAIASSPSRFESWNRRTISPQLGQPKCDADGTATSSPLIGNFNVLCLSTMGVPQVGQASSARVRSRRVPGALLRRGFLMVAIFVLMERDHGAVFSQNELDVDDRSRYLRLEQVHPFSGRFRLQPAGRFLGRKVSQHVAGVVLVEASFRPASSRRAFSVKETLRAVASSRIRVRALASQRGILMADHSLVDYAYG